MYNIIEVVEQKPFSFASVATEVFGGSFSPTPEIKVLTVYVAADGPIEVDTAALTIQLIAKGHDTVGKTLDVRAIEMGVN